MENIHRDTTFIQERERDQGQDLNMGTPFIEMKKCMDVHNSSPGARSPAGAPETDQALGHPHPHIETGSTGSTTRSRLHVRINIVSTGPSQATWFLRGALSLQETRDLCLVPTSEPQISLSLRAC